MYVLLVVAAAAVHMIFIGYVLFGGFLALRWPRTIWLHTMAVGWATVNAFLGVECPLTDVERWARVRQGMEPLPSTGFIDYYLTGTVYPSGAAIAVRNLAFVIIVVSWIVFAIQRRRTAHLRDIAANYDRDGAGPQ